MDLGVIAMKGILHFSNLLGWSLAIRWFNVMYRTLIRGGVLPFCRNAVSVFNSSSQMSYFFFCGGGTSLQGIHSVYSKSSPIVCYNGSRYVNNTSNLYCQNYYIFPQCYSECSLAFLETKLLYWVFVMVILFFGTYNHHIFYLRS